MRDNESKISWGNGVELLVVVTAVVAAGFFAKLPDYFSIAPENYYIRNAGFIAFLPLIAFFGWKRKLTFSNGLIVSAIIATAALYINLVPGEFPDYGDTMILAFIHLPVFLWFVFGAVFIGLKPNDAYDRMGFLRYNADLVVVSTLILISGAILTGITFALFATIEIDIQEFYFDYVVIHGLVGTPIVANFVISKNPNLVHKVSPIIARIFAPLVLLTVIAYLVSVVYTGKDPYNDREFLLIFNGLLIAVMGIVIFSIAEFKDTASRWNLFVTIGLAVTTIVVNGVALSAIGFRITEWGFTPNRTVVLGENVLIFAHLILIVAVLVRVMQRKAALNNVESLVSRFLPLYGVWTAVVVFLFPVMHGFS